MKKRVIICAGLVLTLGLIGCNGEQSETHVDTDSANSVPMEEEAQIPEEEVQFEVGDISLVESSGEIVEYSDTDKYYTYEFVVQNNSGKELTSVSVNCEILDSEGNILGTTTSSINAHIGNGIKATVSGGFNYLEYPGAAMLMGTSGYYNTNNDIYVAEVEYPEEDVKKTALNLEELNSSSETDEAQSDQENNNLGVSGNGSDDSNKGESDVIDSNAPITKEALYKNVLDTVNSLKQIHANPDSFELLGAVVMNPNSDDPRTVINISYIGSDNNIYTDYFWKGLHDSEINARFAEDNYTGNGGRMPIEQLDLNEIANYETSGDYTPSLTPVSKISTEK